MTKIRYTTGNVTKPLTKGIKIICNLVNLDGIWKRGLTSLLSGKWPKVEEEYNTWFTTKKNFELGAIQLIQVEIDTYVCNMLAQTSYGCLNNSTTLDYEALKNCFHKVSGKAVKEHASIHMNQIGCGINVGGDWETVLRIIEEQLESKNIPIFIHDYQLARNATVEEAVLVA